jgi:aconitate hydratase
VIKGPNIKDVPRGRPVPDDLTAPVLIVLGDKVSTDDISPSGTKSLMFRTNVPAISEFCFRNVDPSFVERAKAAGVGIIVGGSSTARARRARRRCSRRCTSEFAR